MALSGFYGWQINLYHLADQVMGVEVKPAVLMGWVFLHQEMMSLDAAGMFCINEVRWIFRHREPPALKPQSVSVPTSVSLNLFSVIDNDSLNDAFKNLK